MPYPRMSREAKKTRHEPEPEPAVPVPLRGPSQREIFRLSGLGPGSAALPVPAERFRSPVRVPSWTPLKGRSQQKEGPEAGVGGSTNRRMDALSSAADVQRGCVRSGMGRYGGLALRNSATPSTCRLPRYEGSDSYNAMQRSAVGNPLTQRGSRGSVDHIAIRGRVSYSYHRRNSLSAARLNRPGELHTWRRAHRGGAVGAFTRDSRWAANVDMLETELPGKSSHTADAEQGHAAEHKRERAQLMWDQENPPAPGNGSRRVTLAGRGGKAGGEEGQDGESEASDVGWQVYLAPPTNPFPASQQPPRTTKGGEEGERRGGQVNNNRPAWNSRARARGQSVHFCLPDPLHRHAVRCGAVRADLTSTPRSAPRLPPHTSDGASLDVECALSLDWSCGDGAPFPEEIVDQGKTASRRSKERTSRFSSGSGVAGHGKTRAPWQKGRALRPADDVGIIPKTAQSPGPTGASVHGLGDLFALPGISRCVALRREEDVRDSSHHLGLG
ncbi:unnamed protein product [Diplocarpon coronariae]